MFDIISTEVVVHQFLAHQFEVKGAFGLRFLRLNRWELFHLERYSEMRFFYSDAGKLRNVSVQMYSFKDQTFVIPCLMKM